MFKPLLISIIFLAGCSDDESITIAKTTAERHIERRAKAEEQLNKTPASRIYAIGDNQMIVIDVSAADSGGFVEIQHCYIWRDREFRQSTMSCGQLADVVLGN